MIIHRDASTDLYIYYLAEAFDTLGVRICAINQDQHGRWHIWGQTHITDEQYVLNFIDDYFNEKLEPGSTKKEKE